MSTCTCRFACRARATRVPPALAAGFEPTAEVLA
jgi:hypothetical protein